MKNRRFQFEYRKSASKLHRMVGDFLRGSPVFSGYEAYQEYPVNKVNTSYEDSSHHFDWVIPKLSLVIECHGKQHYEVSSFGMSDEEAIAAFKGIKSRDISKKEAALRAGYIYVTIPYTTKSLTDELLLDLIKLGEPEVAAYNGVQDVEEVNRAAEEAKARSRTQRQRYLSSDFHQEQLAKAREYAKTQYRRYKELARSK